MKNLFIILSKHKLFLLLNSINSIIKGITFSYLSIYLPKLIIDNLYYNSDVKIIYKIIIFSSIFCLFTYFIQSIYDNLLKPILEERAICKDYKELIYIFYTQEYNCFQRNLDRLYISIKNYPYCSVNVINKTGSILENIVVFICSLFILLIIDYLMIIFVLLFSVIAYLLNIKYNKIIIKRNKEIGNLYKEKNYIDDIYFYHKYYKDIRTSNLNFVLSGNYDNILKNIYNEEKKYSYKKFVLSIIIFFFSDLSFEIINTLYLLYLLVNKMTISIGTFTSLFSSTNQIYKKLSSIAQTISQISIDIGYYSNIHKFYKKNYETSFWFTNVKKIRFDNINYSYEDFALDIPFFEFKLSERIAIVGKNGSGKTTFAKIIKEYLNVSGLKITMDEKEVSNNYSEYARQKIFYMPQESILYHYSFCENVLLDNCSGLNIQKFNNSIKIFNGTDIKFNESIYDKNVSKEFSSDGMELSRGESQAIFLSRLLSYIDKDIYILDEPTSSLNKKNAGIMIDYLFKNNKNKSFIIITHDEQIAKKCDKIYVFKEGKIIESGTHNQLILNNTEYESIFKRKGEENGKK